MDDENPQRAWHFKQLRWSLHALATAGSPQPSLFPDQVRTPSELAFDFDHWLTVIRTHYEPELTSTQQDALTAISQKLATISRDGAEFDVELWTDAALTTSEHWEDVRRLAAVAVDALV